MIVLKTLRWSNCFSYGKDNKIVFDEDPIAQIIGKNGHGKSSIPLILEEVLFNKNSKGIKKADIINRYTKDKSYSIELDFDKDGDFFEIKMSRGSSQTLILLKNGDNISAHTATNTFKMVEEILGFDHKTFAQLVYQSSSSSLEFLTATDTNRKKFLIDLLNLSKYTSAFEYFKAQAKVLAEELTRLETKVSTTQSWLDKSAKEDLVKLPTVMFPVPNISIESEYNKLSADLQNISVTNKKIASNNLYKQQLESIPLEDITKPISAPVPTAPLISELGGHKKAIKDSELFVGKINNLKGVCPTCLQEVDTTKLKELVEEQEEIQKDAKAAIRFLDSKLEALSVINAETAKVSKLKADWETYHSLIDNTLPDVVLDAEGIEARIAVLSAEISKYKEECEVARKQEIKVSAHNSKVDVITSQMDGMKADLVKYSSELSGLSSKLAILQILQKTFSTNGLIAYKIECLVKDLEILANEYLTEISSGRFQLTFKVAASDKLNVVITDNGKDIDILALSGGERARVNTSTLLAIRKLMQSLSNARVNLLILDETIDALDTDGKEKLVEILVKEEHLNTFLISHGFTHPLLEKLTVVKENNISRLE